MAANARFRRSGVRNSSLSERGGTTGRRTSPPQRRPVILVARTASLGWPRHVEGAGPSIAGHTQTTDTLDVMATQLVAVTMGR
jgi:hypothetical protein